MLRELLFSFCCSKKLVIVFLLWPQCSDYVSVLYRFLNQAMQLFDSTTVVPTNFVFFTISAILAGKSDFFTVSVCNCF